jgi:diguanylate cyclase (GGDEF)-like protein
MHWGHAAGDEILKQIAKRLEACARSEDTVGRLSGDEFTVVLSKVTAPDDAALVAKKILQLLSAPFLLEQTQFCVTASIGIALYPTDSTDHSELIRNADIAMYQAKAAGRNSYRFFCGTASG